MNKQIVIIAISLLFFLNSFSQTDTIQLSLHEAIALAQDSSLSAFQAKYSFETGYWIFHNYQARRLPTITLDLLPLMYNHSISRQFNTIDTSYRYYEQQTLNNSLSLNLSQNITPTGGKLYAKSDLGRFKNFIGNYGNTYSTSPLRVGINQPIMGFNTYKWEKRIEPLKYQKAKLDYIQSIENIALETVNLYFNLVFAEQNLKIAMVNYSNADTLFQIGQKRLQLMSINKADYLTLQLEVINTKNRLKEAQNNYEKTMSALCVFLGISQKKAISTKIPDKISLTSVMKEVVVKLVHENNPFYLDISQQTEESERDLERARIESRFSSNLDLSFGLNQTGKNIYQAYKNPSEQQSVTFTVQVPILDWGQRRGRYNLEKSLQKLKASTIKQNAINFEQNIIISVNKFNLQVEIVKSTMEATNVANQVYEMNKTRFLLGQMDVNTLIIQLNRRENAIISYLNALKEYWHLYFNLRYTTLFDFEKNTTLIKDIDERLNL